jgi:serine/threonine protein kinase
MAPEIIFGHEYSHSADVWSLGCLFFQLLTGFPPFMGESIAELAANLEKGVYFIPKTVQLSLEGASFLNELL